MQFPCPLQVADNTGVDKVWLSVFGNVLITCSFVLLGPLPAIPAEPSVGLCMAGVACAGIGKSLTRPDFFML